MKTGAIIKSILISISKTGLFMWAVIHCKELFLFVANKMMVLNIMVGKMMNVNIVIGEFIENYTNIMEGFVKTGGAIYIAIKIFLIVRNNKKGIKTDKDE